VLALRSANKSFSGAIASMSVCASRCSAKGSETRRAWLVSAAVGVLGVEDAVGAMSIFFL
jgi:hypothetical protein